MAHATPWSDDRLAEDEAVAVSVSARQDDAAHPPVTDAEVKSWYAVDWANSVFSAMGISGFLPLLVQSCALVAASFPAVCPNVVTDADEVARVFPASLGYGNLTAMFAMQNVRPGSCTEPGMQACREGYCKGMPATVNDCRVADGSSLFALRVSGTSIDPTAFASLSLSLSVAAQVLVFICCAALADFGNLRKKTLIVSGLVGGIFSCACAGIVPESWWLGLPLMVITNCALGVNSIMANAYLPVLVGAHPEVRTLAAQAAEAAAKEVVLQADTSARSTLGDGMGSRSDGSPPVTSGAHDAAASHSPQTTVTQRAPLLPANGGSPIMRCDSAKSDVRLLETIPTKALDNEAAPGSATPACEQGATLVHQHVVSTSEAVRCADEYAEQLYDLEQRLSSRLSSNGIGWGYVSGIVGIILCIPASFLMNEIPAYQVSMVVCGVWWIVFTYPTWRFLRPRPGPPLPPGQGVLRASFIGLRHTIRDIVRLRKTLAFLLLWMVYSDGVYVIGTLGGLFANTEVEWGCMSKTVGILAIFALVPVTAALGIKAHLMILARYPRISTKRMLLIALYMCTVIPLYALIGLFTTNLGVQQGWEIILVAVWYGFCLGPVIAHARSLFALLIPRGKESAFYSMFELTNRGSSAAGPAIIALIQQLTGNLRFGFIFVLLSILLPAILLEFVDIQAGAQAAKAASHTPPVSLVKPLPAAGTPRSKPAAGPAAVASCASVELTAINPAHSFIHREPRAAPTVTSA